ncbi:hypothetical protein H311_00424, partial [Anncaliia algerae PRA109]
MLFNIIYSILIIKTKILLTNKSEIEFDKNIFKENILSDASSLKTQKSWFSRKNYFELGISKDQYDILERLVTVEFTTEKQLETILEVILKYCTEQCINKFITNLIKMLEKKIQTKSFELLKIFKKYNLLDKFVFRYWESLGLDTDCLQYECFFNKNSSITTRSNLNYLSITEEDRFLTLKYKKEILNKMSNDEFFREALISLEVECLEIFIDLPEKELLSSNLKGIKVKRNKDNFIQLVKMLKGKTKFITHLNLELETEKDLNFLKEFNNLKIISLNCNLINLENKECYFPNTLVLLELKSSAIYFFNERNIKNLANLKTLILQPFSARNYLKKDFISLIKSKPITSLFYFTSEIITSQEFYDILENKNIRNLQIGVLENDFVVTDSKFNNISINILGLSMQEMDDRKLNVLKNFPAVNDLTLTYSPSPFSREKRYVKFPSLESFSFDSLRLTLSPFYSYNFDILNSLRIKKLNICTINLYSSSMNLTKHEINIFDDKNNTLIQSIQEISLHRLKIILPEKYSMNLSLDTFFLTNCECSNFINLINSIESLKEGNFFYMEMKEYEILRL